MRWDKEAGLFYQRNRWYDPELMRWSSWDPIGYGDGMNPMAFVGGNPISGLDFMGTQSESDATDLTSLITQLQAIYRHDNFLTNANDFAVNLQVIGPVKFSVKIFTLQEISGLQSGVPQDLVRGTMKETRYPLIEIPLKLWLESQLKEFQKANPDGSVQYNTDKATGFSRRELPEHLYTGTLFLPQAVDIAEIMETAKVPNPFNWHTNVFIEISFEARLKGWVDFCQNSKGQNLWPPTGNAHKGFRSGMHTLEYDNGYYLLNDKNIPLQWYPNK
jgi:RHS repeat-associated protein